MKKIFLATSFSGQINPSTGTIIPEFRTEIEKLLHALRQKKYEVFCAVEVEGWQISDTPPENGVKVDLEEIDKADILLGLVHDQPSAGVQFEVGYAVALNKEVIIARHSEGKLSYFNLGLVNYGRAKEITYNDLTDIVNNIN